MGRRAESVQPTLPFSALTTSGYDCNALIAVVLDVIFSRDEYPVVADSRPITLDLCQVQSPTDARRRAGPRAALAGEWQ